MAERGYKLQEFVAHSANVNCLKIGKKACRLLITGGDDHKVNMWAIGKPTSLMSLCGHTSPVESVAFDSAEVLVLAGASTGAIKMWDLEEAKMVRTLTGHRSNCTAVEFHPFGEFFASGAMDTNLRIWDIRKKGCIHTYRGHTRGISTIRFTPDGRWVVSGGLDNVVKVWDLTAGKLLHDFKFHEGHIRSIDFHPLEFLLATGSADRTVKFWDLETFELIGSARPEATGVRTITFHPDGRTLFSGLDDCLKVYSWEPVICHDSIDMGWSALGDLCINDGKLLGCSFYRNSVGVWVADLSHIEPYGVGVPEQNVCTEDKFVPLGNHSLEKIGSGVRSTSGSRCTTPDYETKDIKTIYVDSTGGKPVAPEEFRSLNSPKVVHALDCKEISDLQTEKQSPAVKVSEKSDEQAIDKSFIVPSIVPRESPAGKDSSISARESITFSRTKPGMLLRPADVPRPSNSTYDSERLSTALESGSFKSMKSELDNAVDPNLKAQIVSSDGARKSCEETEPHIKGVTKIEKVLSPQRLPNQDNSDESPDCSKGKNSVRFVNGVAVVPGRTRSLVERFERREKFNSNEDQAANICPHTRLSCCEDQASDITPQTRLSNNKDQAAANITPQTILGSNEDQAINITPHMRLDTNEDQANNITPDMRLNSSEDEVINIAPHTRLKSSVGQATNTPPHMILSSSKDQAINSIPRARLNSSEGKATNIPPRTRYNRHGDQKTSITPHLRFNGVAHQQMTTTHVRLKNNVNQAASTTPHVRFKNNEDQATVISSHLIVEADERPAILKGEPQISGRDATFANDGEVIENLMQTHDVFVSSLQSRLTKLQVVRHFWERKDIKGAVSALRKLPDHSVQADVISVLMEKMEILNLDLFSCLLPVLVGLLDSKMERHASISLEILLKLVAVFGPVVFSTIAAPPAVGVDIHAEQRRVCCNQCFKQLQKIKKILPILVRRGGLLAKCALELNLVLQES